MRRTTSGEWLIERESESTPGLAYTIRVSTKGAAAHEYAPGAPFRCTANEYGRQCRHLEQAPALAATAELVTEMLQDIADERADYTIGESHERIIDLRERIDNAVWDAEDALGVRIRRVTDERWEQNV